jgi:hypothetical protein
VEKDAAELNTKLSLSNLWEIGPSGKPGINLKQHRVVSCEDPEKKKEGRRRYGIQPTIPGNANANWPCTLECDCKLDM